MTFIYKRPVFPGDMPDVQISVSYMKTFESYCLTDRQTDTTEITYHANSLVVSNNMITTVLFGCMTFIWHSLHILSNVATFNFETPLRILVFFYQSWVRNNNNNQGCLQYLWKLLPMPITILWQKLLPIQMPVLLLKSIASTNNFVTILFIVFLHSATCISFAVIY